MANGSCTANPAQLGLQMDEGDAVSDANHYVVSVAAGPTGIASSYVIPATAAVNSGQAHDESYTTLSLDSLDQRLPDPNDSRCW